MSVTNVLDIRDGSLPAESTDSSPLTQMLQTYPERPWLIRAQYYLEGEDIKGLKLPGAEQSPPYNPIYFSRPFLSKWIGGSQGPAFTWVNTGPQDKRVYHLAAYYVGMREWNPQFPKRPGENGAALLVGKPFRQPSVPWLTAGGASSFENSTKNQSFNCFVKKSSAKYEYIGRFVFHSEFRKLTNEEVEQYVPKACRDLWAYVIDMSRWGAEIKGKHEGRKAEDLFNLPDDDPCKLCFYWEYMEYIGYDQSLYDALCAKGEEIGWTTRKPYLSEGLTRTEAVEEESTADMEMVDMNQYTAPMLSNSKPEAEVDCEKPENESENEDLEQST